jgi:hypothetical protein
MPISAGCSLRRRIFSDASEGDKDDTSDSGALSEGRQGTFQGIIGFKCRWQEGALEQTLEILEICTHHRLPHSIILSVHPGQPSSSEVSDHLRFRFCLNGRHWPTASASVLASHPTFGRQPFHNNACGCAASQSNCHLRRRIKRCSCVRWPVSCMPLPSQSPIAAPFASAGAGQLHTTCNRESVETNRFCTPSTCRLVVRSHGHEGRPGLP